VVHGFYFFLTLLEHLDPNLDTHKHKFKLTFYWHLNFNFFWYKRSMKIRDQQKIMISQYMVMG